ncbi:MAG: hypothetical protein HY447_02545 [Candidatus Omnitrophica bacterium]|nr:hypothetical protein [Candidatus Omnitrophota bacterium]
MATVTNAMTETSVRRMILVRTMLALERRFSVQEINSAILLMEFANVQQALTSVQLITSASHKELLVLTPIVMITMFVTGLSATTERQDSANPARL